MLRVNGILVIDDIDIIGCHIVRKFLLTDPDHEVVVMHENYAIFRKIKYSPPQGDWPSQPFSKTKITSDADILNVLGV